MPVARNQLIFRLLIGLIVAFLVINFVGLLRGNMIAAIPVSLQSGMLVTCLLRVPAAVWVVRGTLSRTIA